MRIIAACALAFAAMLIAPAWAQESKLSEKETQAWNNVQEELTACAAYFNVAKTCAPEDAKADELRQMDRIIDHMNTLALLVGSRIGMTQDAMVSRLRIALEDQTKLIRGKCVNFPSLMARHLDRCKSLGDHPDETFREYMNR